MNRHSPIPNLKGIINALIDSLNAAGTLLELHQHWSEKKNPLIEDKEIESANILRIATSADVPPFSFIENNKIIGLDIDLVRLLKKRLNIKTEIVRTERDYFGVWQNRLHRKRYRFFKTLPHRENSIRRTPEQL